MNLKSVIDSCQLKWSTWLCMDFHFIPDLVFQKKETHTKSLKMLALIYTINKNLLHTQRGWLTYIHLAYVYYVPITLTLVYSSQSNPKLGCSKFFPGNAIIFGHRPIKGYIRTKIKWQFKSSIIIYSHIII